MNSHFKTITFLKNSKKGKNKTDLENDIKQIYSLMKGNHLCNHQPGSRNRMFASHPEKPSICPIPVTPSFSLTSNHYPNFPSKSLCFLMLLSPTYPQVLQYSLVHLKKYVSFKSSFSLCVPLSTPFLFLVIYLLMNWGHLTYRASTIWILLTACA